MASYSYPPPGPPPPAQGVPPPPAGYQPQYGAPYRGGGVGGPSRGRGGFHPAGRGDGPSPYNAGPQGYPTPAPGSYGSPAPGSYPPPQQQWHPEQGHHHPPPATPLPPQNYHPNYAPQIYQQPQYPPAGPPHPPYQHGPPPPQPYNPNFPQAPPANGPPPPDWSGQTGHQPGYSGRGRGGGDRGGRAPTMGPPIRIGFDDGRSHDPAQASGNGYPQPYPDPHQSQYPPAPFPSYPPAQPQPPMAGPSYDYYGGGRGRGGFQNNRGGRPHHGHGNDKFRHQKSGGNHVKQEHQKPDDNATGKKKKRKTANTLGLTPGDANGDGEDWENEEEKLRDLLGNEAIKVNDLATWLADRKRMFPTKARIEARKAEAANQPPKEENASAPLTKVELKELEAAKLRKKLQKLESHIKRKREQHDEGDEMRDVDDSSSESSEEEEEKPESLPSKPQSLPSNKADPSKHCKYYSTGGTCGKKGKCRFVHDPEVRAAALKEREANGGRLTLQQRLMLNDKEQEDLTVLKTIQHFKDSGKLGGPAYASAPAKEPSQLPPAPSSLPPHPSIPPKPKTNPDANWPGQQPKK